jgi:hypothetical protein
LRFPGSSFHHFVILCPFTLTSAHNPSPGGGIWVCVSRSKQMGSWTLPLPSCHLSHGWHLTQVLNGRAFIKWNCAEEPPILYSISAVC